MSEKTEVTVVPSSTRLPLDAVNLVACPRPLSTQRIVCQRPAGGTVADHLRAIGMFPDQMFARVFIDDRLIPQAEWEYAAPKAGQFLTVRTVPMGGGGGGKDALRIVAMIGVLVAAAFTVGGGLAGLGFLPEGLAMGFGYGTIASQVAGAFVGIGGLLAVSGRIPPPLPRRSLLEPGRKEAA